MSSASRGSGTRRRMKLRSRDCSRLTTSEIRWSCWSGIGSALAASFIYGCRRIRGADIVGSVVARRSLTTLTNGRSRRPGGRSRSRMGREQPLPTFEQLRILGGCFDVSCALNRNGVTVPFCQLFQRFARGVLLIQPLNKGCQAVGILPLPHSRELVGQLLVFVAGKTPH